MDRRSNQRCDFVETVSINARLPQTFVSRRMAPCSLGIESAAWRTFAIAINSAWTGHWDFALDFPEMNSTAWRPVSILDLRSGLDFVIIGCLASGGSTPGLTD